MQNFQSPKTSLWGKMRSSTKQLSSSLANLSLRSEHDGDSEDATLVHKALVNRYVQSGEPFPEWLGVSVAQQQLLQQEQFQPQQQQQQQQQRQQRQQSHSAPSSSTTRTSSSAGSVADKYKRPSASSSFKDIYNRAPSTSSVPTQHSLQQQQYQQQPQHQSAPMNNNNGINSTRPTWGQANSAGNVASSQGHSTEDRGSAMRDRLKRNNYRSNFGV